MTAREPKTNRRRYRPAEYGERAGEWQLGGWSHLQRRFMITAFKPVQALRKGVRRIYDRAQLSKQYEDRLRRDHRNIKGLLNAKASLDRNVLKQWAERWNLTDHWCIEWVAAEKIGRWYEADQADLQSIAPWVGGEVHTLGLPTEPFNFKTPAWDPTRQTKVAYKAETRRKFEIALEDNCGLIEKELESFGSLDAKAGQFRPHFVRAPEIRQADYFRYLVAYQILRISLKTISETTGLDRGAVRRGVTLLASKIKLTLRPSANYTRPAATALKLLRSSP